MQATFAFHDTTRTTRPHRLQRYLSREYKVVSLREMPVTDICETPEHVYRYWRDNIAPDPRHNPDVESAHVILLNRRNRPLGHSLIAQGILDGVTLHSREIFRSAIVAAAAHIILLHNHPSGDTTPSSADLEATRDMTRAGQLLKIDLLDHVIVAEPSRVPPGRDKFFSLRQSGLIAF